MLTVKDGKFAIYKREPSEIPGLAIGRTRVARVLPIV